MLETIGMDTAAIKAKRISASNELGFPSKRQKKDEAPMQKRAPRGQGQNARERTHRGTSEAHDVNDEAEEKVVAKGDEGTHDGTGFNEDNAQDGREGHARVRGRGGRGRGGTRVRGRNRGRPYATAGSGRGRGRGRKVDYNGDAGVADVADREGFGGDPNSDPEKSDGDGKHDNDNEEDVYDVDEEDDDDDEDSAVEEDDEEEVEERKTTPGRGRGGRGRGRGRGAASESGIGRRGRGGRGQSRSRGQGSASQGQMTAGGSAADEGAAEMVKKPKRRQGQQLARRRGVDTAAAAAVDDIEMPSEVELQEMWHMLASEPESVVSAEGILRVANQLGLSDYDSLVGPMMEFAREKVPGLSPNSNALSFYQFRRMLEALYNPQLPGEQPPQPQLQQRGVQPDGERQQRDRGAAVVPQQASAGPETAGPGLLGGMEGGAGADGVVMTAAVPQVDGAAEEGS
ncbi:hypothetical protein Vretimale_10783 [Volvox reticuliferus]|uniref:Uncharacterized protein n=2 Tax=Volvox reticuliferus TaxID=1737510 RepID=A0A8J4GGD7_9CHLO|nr:hypothetical protein Vretimale_10783 [Volvox reticuliferus]